MEVKKGSKWVQVKAKEHLDFLGEKDAVYEIIRAAQFAVYFKNVAIEQSSFGVSASDFEECFEEIKTSDDIKLPQLPGMDNILKPIAKAKCISSEHGTVYNPEPDVFKVIYNKPAVIVYYSNHGNYAITDFNGMTKGVAICTDRDTYDPKVGYEIAKAKAMIKWFRKRVKHLGSLSEDIF